MSSAEAARARFDFDRLRPWLPLLTLVGLMLIIGVTQPEFLTPNNLIQLAGDTATLFVLAAGVSFAIMLGGIDLSIQAMASLASVLIALTIARIGYGSFVLALLVGALSGWAGGMAHVKLKIPSFIATLAVGGVLAGVARRPAPQSCHFLLWRPFAPPSRLASHPLPDRQAEARADQAMRYAPRIDQTDRAAAS